MDICSGNIEYIYIYNHQILGETSDTKKKKKDRTVYK